MSDSFISIVVADDHPVVLKGVVDVLQSCEGMKVLAACGDGISALDAIRRLKPDIAVLDLAMPGANGLQTLEMMEAEKLKTKVVFLTGSIGGQQVARALSHGASAILLKDSALEELVLCVKAVSDGQKWISPDLMDCEREFRTRTQTMQYVLTARERGIMRLVAQGLSNKTVARQLDLSEGTVKMHLHNIYQKTGVSNRTELTVLALAHMADLT